MRLANTTGAQDSVIDSAQRGDHIADLVDIIECLDGQITEWLDASGVGSPAELIAKLGEVGA